MTWWEDAARADAASAPFADGFDVPETLDRDDFCLHCHRNGTYSCDRCRLPEVEGPLMDAWRELQRAIGEAS